MLDLATLVALALGLRASLRQRFWFGALVAASIAVATGVAPVVLHADEVSGEFAATLLFVGPSALMPAPFTREASQLLLAAAAFGVASRRAWRLRPESADARAWDATSRPFLAVAVIRALIAVAGGTIEFFLSRTVS